MVVAFLPFVEFMDWIHQKHLLFSTGEHTRCWVWHTKVSLSHIFPLFLQTLHLIPGGPRRIQDKDRRSQHRDCQNGWKRCRADGKGLEAACPMSRTTDIQVSAPQPDNLSMCVPGCRICKCWYSTRQAGSSSMKDTQWEAKFCVKLYSPWRDTTISHTWRSPPWKNEANVHCKLPSQTVCNYRL